MAAYCRFLVGQLLVVFCYGPTATNAITYYVSSSNNDSCPSTPCLSFNDYVSQHNQYFQSNTLFKLLPGMHMLDLSLLIRDISNITLCALEDEHSTQIVMGPFHSIAWIHSSDITITGLEIYLSGQLNDESDSAFAAFYFDQTNSSLSNLHFIGNNSFQSTAILGTSSSVLELSDVMVSRAVSSYGAALVVTDSIVRFIGQNNFAYNTATQGGGAMYFVRSVAAFDGNVSFDNNIAIRNVYSESAYGGAILCENSQLSFSGSVLFNRNQANVGGGIFVLGETSIVRFEPSSNILLTENIAVGGNGGAIGVIDSQVLVLGRALFEKNFASQGGALAGVSSTILCDSSRDLHKIVLRNNSAIILGGAILTIKSAAILKGVLFTNNYAAFGGVLVARAHDSMAPYLHISSCDFCNNTASVNSVLLFSAEDVPTDTPRPVLFDGENNFMGNLADGGSTVSIHNSSNVTFSGDNNFLHNSVYSLGTGSLSLYDSTGYVYGTLTFNVNNVGSGGGFFRSDSNLTIYGNVSFNANSAMNGGAMTLTSSEIQVLGCIQCFNNFVSSSGAALFVVNSKITVRNSGNCIVFEANVAKNTGGAVYAGDSTIILSGSLKFTENFAYTGAAIALSGSSKLALTAPLQAHFAENHASTVGGAILYIDAFSPIQCSRSSDPYVVREDCFIELDSTNNIHLSFVNNSAEAAGSIFYGGNLDYCRLYVGGGTTDSCGNRMGGDFRNESISTLNEISQIIRVENLTSTISSDPIQLCFCANGSADLQCYDQVIDIVRGKEFTLMALTIGQYNGSVPSFVKTSLDNDITISKTQRVQTTGKQCTPITYRLSSSKNTTSLVLFPNGPCKDTGVSRREIAINFLPCPDGFTLDGSECVCEDRLQRYTSTCSVDNNSIMRTSNNFWMGVLYDNETYKGLILHSGCPFDYCIDTPVFITLDNLDVQCNHNHSGILCGSCDSGYSIAFGTLHCLPCSNAYLSLILLFAFAGIALVVFILLLRLSVANGTINGLIFYANVIQVNRSIFFPPGHTNFLTVFIAWLNLDLGIQICFFDGMDTYIFTWLQFVFPLYVWFLIGLIIVMSRYSDKIAQYLGKLNPVATLATLVLLSYSKILRTVIVSLSFTRLEYPYGIEVVWLYDGNLLYFQTAKHIVLGVIALIVLLFLFLPYTLLLLCGHWLQACSNRKILAWLNKIKPFMDAYHAPYKKETRYWTGLILIVRCMLFLAFAFNALGNPSVNLLAVTSVTAILMVFGWIRKGIYESFLNDVLEAAFILDLCILAAGTYHVKEIGGSQAKLAYTLIGIAFVVFFCTVIYHIFLLLRQQKTLWDKLPRPIHKMYQKCSELCGSNKHEDAAADEVALQDHVHDSGEISLKAPTTTTVELPSSMLREPLLSEK